MAKRIKYILFLVILLMLAAPALQSFFHIVTERHLRGDFVFLEQPELNKASWLDGSYQAGFDPWMEENIGFHPTLVRLRNQYDYSIFHVPHADGILRGNGGQLYEFDYIRAWSGEDFVGEKLLDKKLRQFRYLQKHLKEEYDIDLVLVLEPSKASVYPEGIPDHYTKAPPGLSNYDYISARAQELDINLIDFNDYFVKIRDTVEYPLFPPQGIHWSEFAMWYAADSLMSYIEEIRDIQLREVAIDKVDYSHQLRSTDYDVGTVLNLLFELEHGEMPYPQYHFSNDSTHPRPNILSVADSYYWNIFNSKILKRISDNEAFWYFYNKVYPDYYYHEKVVADLDLKAEVEKQDVIFLMITERFLYKFDRGFIDDLWALYGIHTDADPIILNQTNISRLDSWFANVIKEAKDSTFSLGEMLEKEAIFMMWKHQPEKYFSLYGPKVLIKTISSDSNWYAQVQERAYESNISTEERLMLEADYLLKTQYPEAHKKYYRIQQISANIRADSSWLSSVKEKAEANFMTEEEMIRADAEFVYWEENQ